MPVVELLQAHHDRPSFNCGKQSLNEFLQKQARQNADRNVGVTHVIVPAAGDPQILGYYTLVTRTIDSVVVPDKKLPHGPIGVVLLGRLAVDKRAQGQGLGKRMLIRAMMETEKAARKIEVYALVLDALDEDARAWYKQLNFGSAALLDDPNHLYLRVKDIQQLGLLEDRQSVRRSQGPTHSPVPDTAS